MPYVQFVSLRWKARVKFGLQQKCPENVEPGHPPLTTTGMFVAPVCPASNAKSGSYRPSAPVRYGVPNANTCVTARPGTVVAIGEAPASRYWADAVPPSGRVGGTVHWR